jgi:hypothetical protein
VTLCTDNFYPLTAVTEVARLISNCTLTEPLPHHKQPNLNCAFPIKGAKSILFRFHHLMTSTLVLTWIPCSQHIQCLNLKFASILQGWFSSISSNKLFGSTYSLFLCPAINKKTTQMYAVL